MSVFAWFYKPASERIRIWRQVSRTLKVVAMLLETFGSSSHHPFLSQGLAHVR